MLVAGAARGGASGVVSSAHGVHGVVLAGSYPNGQSPLDGLVPRPLLPVAQRPLVTYALRFLRSGGLQAATVCVNRAAREVESVIAKAPDLGLRLDYLEDWTPRGAAGCLLDAACRTEADTFVVVDGTGIPMLSLRKLIEAHRASEAAMTVVVSPLGRGRAAGQRPTGVYVVDRRVLAHIPALGFQDIKERLVPRLYRAGEAVRTFAATDVSPRAVTTETYLELERWMLERLPEGAPPLDGFGVRQEALVHRTAVVENGARLLGPVLVGPGAYVGRGATVLGPASVGEGARIAPESVVSRSALWSGCEVGERAYVDLSLLADGARVARGASLHATLHAPAPRARDRQPRGLSFGVGWEALGAALRRPSTTGHS